MEKYEIENPPYKVVVVNKQYKIEFGCMTLDEARSLAFKFQKGGLTCRINDLVNHKVIAEYLR